jgi:cyclophilin family peptidyl-prolyl cis-trans isomerase
MEFSHLKMLFLLGVMLCGVLYSQTEAFAGTKVLMKTSAGDITIELNDTEAPNTVANFLKYVDSKHYDGTIFHRVIKGFMVQGGGYTADMQDKTTQAPIKNEANNGLMNDRGTLAMARTNDPHSATAQFFINTVNNGFLNYKSASMQGWGYCVFGKVVEGMDAVDKIEAVQTGNKGGMQDVPIETVEIISVTRL